MQLLQGNATIDKILWAHCALKHALQWPLIWPIIPCSGPPLPQAATDHSHVSTAS